jgi:hypothetical protein
MNMKPILSDLTTLDGATLVFYGDVLDLLLKHHAPFLVGGAFALNCYAGVTRDTKDLDLFVRPRDCQAVLDVLARAGYRTELTFPHWLGKAYAGERVIDVIFSSGNGHCEVDDYWFSHSVEATALGRPVMLCPPEEMIWVKTYVMERERFDGADVNHLIRACGRTLNWQRLLVLFGPHWRLLLAHLTMFGFVYPAERAIIPMDVIDILLDRLREEQTTAPAERLVCQGTLLSRAQYLPDIQDWGYQDARLPPHGQMSREHLDIWTGAIGVDNPSLEQ